MDIHVIFLVLVSFVTANMMTEKRLVLHSETDIIQEINKLRMEVNNLTAAMQTLQSDHTATVNSLTSQISKLQKTNTGGSSYVRWGRTSCAGNGTTLAYSGYMAGAKYSQTGGATNYLCLAGQPTWDYYEEKTNSLGQIFGVEYGFNSHTSDSISKFFGSNIHNDDAPCAVCHTTRGTSIMVPGRTDCYGGWTKEYSGYLVEEYYGHPHGTEYVCLDRRPEALAGGKHNDDENMLRLVDAQCGSLECPPYIQGREMAFECALFDLLMYCTKLKNPINRLTIIYRVIFSFLKQHC